MQFTYGVRVARTLVMRCRKCLIIKKIDFLAIWTGRPRRYCCGLFLRQPAYSFWFQDESLYISETWLLNGHPRLMC